MVTDKANGDGIDEAKSMKSLMARDLFFRMLLKVQAYRLAHKTKCQVCGRLYTFPHQPECEYVKLVQSARQMYGDDCGLLECEVG